MLRKRLRKHNCRKGLAVCRRPKRGFSLVEMLCALLVLSLLTGVIAVGVTASARVYKQEQFASQSQVLLDTIESSLSDPLRFAYTDANKPAIVYRNNQADAKLVNPALQTRPSSKHDSQQVLYLAGENNATGVALLNEGIYGDCTVAVDSFEMTHYPDPSSSAYQTSVALTVSSVSDPSLSLARTFTFTSRPGVTKNNSFAQSTVSGGGIEGHVKPERKGTTVTDRLYGGLGTAVESGFTIYSEGFVAANKHELGTAIKAANAVLDNLGSNADAEKVDALRTALHNAMTVMVNLSATQSEVDEAVEALKTALGDFSGSGGGEITVPTATTVTVTFSEDPGAASGWQYSTMQQDVYAQATVYDQNGNVMGGETVTWRSENTSVFDVDSSSGYLTFKSTGGANVIATTSNGITGYLYVQVLKEDSGDGGGTVEAPSAGAAVTEAQAALHGNLRYSRSSFVWESYGDGLLVAIAHGWGDAVAMVWDSDNFYKLVQNGGDTQQNITHDDAFKKSDLTDGAQHRYNNNYGYSWVLVEP